MRKRKPLRRKLEKEKKLSALENMEVEEISFVPKGANKKKLLVLKEKKLKGAVPYKEFGIAEKDYPWDEAKALQRLREAASSDGKGEEDKIDWGRYKDCFLYQDNQKLGTFEGYKLPIADIVDNVPKIVPAAIEACLSSLRAGTTGIELSEDEKMQMLSRLKTHFQDAGIPFPEESTEEESDEIEDPEKMEAEAEKEEMITDTLQEGKEPPATTTTETQTEEKQVHLVHPEFKQQCQEIAGLLEAKAQELKSLIDGMTVLDTVSLADAETYGMGYRFGRMDLYELPLEVSAKVTELNAISNRMQDKIPWSMMICKEAMDIVEDLDPSENATLTEEKVLQKLGVEKISDSQRTIAAAAMDLLSHLATPKSSKVQADTEEKTEEIDNEKEKAEKEKEKENLKLELEKVKKELKVAKELIQKGRTSSATQISKSQSTGSGEAEKKAPERVVWPSDMAAKYRK